ncbi:YqhV family protein [Fictibacillus macauensis]|nr:YqhV family protein [Fictibacillus macauensis]
MFAIFEKVVLGMAVIRLASGFIEITAALLMLHFNSPEKALMINAGLSIVGPIIFFSTMAIGLLGISSRLNMGSLLWVIAGLALIVIGLKK